ncbi:MAG: hypothetical protein Q4C70_09535 [Planctomycetia bacterium]|nr:hypothetical protein [Planctomycetia bacterium]
MWLGTSPDDLTLITETVYGGEDGGCSTCTGATAKPRLTIQYADANQMRITDMATTGVDGRFMFTVRKM